MLHRWPAVYSSTYGVFFWKKSYLRNVDDFFACFVFFRRVAFFCFMIWGINLKRGIYIGMWCYTLGFSFISIGTLWLTWQPNNAKVIFLYSWPQNYIEASDLINTHLYIYKMSVLTSTDFHQGCTIFGHLADKSTRWGGGGGGGGGGEVEGDWQCVCVWG